MNELTGVIMVVKKYPNTEVSKKDEPRPAPYFMWGIALFENYKPILMRQFLGGIECPGSEDSRDNAIRAARKVGKLVLSKRVKLILGHR